MVSSAPEQRVRLPALEAGWLTQTFVHWPFHPDRVQRLLPDGLTVDPYEEAAWVSFTPFLMADVRPAVLPGATPGLPTFPETNLRTYVRGPDGRDGLWFLSIEVGNPLMLAARMVGAPYHPGRLRLSRDGDVVRYWGVRWGGSPAYEMTVRPGRALTPAQRDVWLTSRWRAYTRRLGVLWETPVAHEPWPLRTAAVERFEETVTRAAGLSPPDAEPVVHFSDGVRNVRMGASRPLPSSFPAHARPPASA
ncbi:YqjF family protein [Streptomyces sp. NPDC001848]|uniref:YqjF family protein n=1 Tax=Streptomyces sp. NPDC001848 TaxID=3364618 RepID=UPI00369182AA